MKRWLIWLLAALLLVSALGCGGAKAEALKMENEVQAEGKGDPVRQEEAAPKTAEPTAAPTAEPTLEPAPTGPVELDRVVYENHGIRVTALGYEDHRQEPEYDANRAESAFDLIMRIEKMEEGIACGFRELSVNGWGSDRNGIYLDREYMSQQGKDPTADPNLQEIAVRIMPQYLETMGIDSVGRFDGLISWRKGDDPGQFDFFSVDLGCPCEPECPVAVSEFSMYRKDGLVYVDNPLDTPVTITFLLQAQDEDGTPLLCMDMARGTLVGGITTSIQVRPHAQKLPVAITQPGSFPWMKTMDQWANEEKSFTLTPLHVQKDIGIKDISNQLSATVEGRAAWNDSYVAVRFTWPEALDRVRYSATMLRYVGDEVVDVAGIRAHVLDRNERDNNGNIYDTGNFYLYTSDTTGERFEVFIDLAQENQE